MQQLLYFTHLLLIAFGIKFILCKSPFYLPSTIRDHILSISSADNKHSKAPEDIQKSVFFFDAAQEAELYPIRIRFPPPQKKVRYVFIKSPEPRLVPEIIPSRPSEEKTVIYVLSKTREALGSITIPSSITNVIKKKPEVYYIRYRDLKHAREILNKNLTEIREGTKISPVSDQNSFIQTLDDTKYSNKLNHTLPSSLSNNSDIGLSYFGHDRKRDDDRNYRLL